MTKPARNILITDAGSGLGRGLSLCLAQHVTGQTITIDGGWTAQ